MRERTLLLAVSAVLIFACAAAALISAHFSRGTRQNGAVFKVLPRRGRSKRAYLSRHPKSVLVFEWQKLLLYCGGVLFLGVCGVLLMSQTPPPAASNMQQVQLAQYISTYTGPVDEAVLVQIRSVRQAEKQIYAESLEDDSKAAFWEYYAARCWALDELCARYEELLDMQAAGHDDLQLLDDQPFERIYGGSGTDFRLVSACVSLLALCLTIPGVFWLERNHGMELLLHSTRSGAEPDSGGGKPCLHYACPSVFGLFGVDTNSFSFEVSVVRGTPALPTPTVCSTGTAIWAARRCLYT